MPVLVPVLLTIAGYTAFAVFNPGMLVRNMGLITLGGPLGIAVGLASRTARLGRAAVGAAVVGSVVVVALVQGAPWYLALTVGVVCGAEAWVLSSLFVRTGVRRLGRPQDVFGLFGLTLGVSVVGGLIASAVINASGTVAAEYLELVVTWVSDDLFGLLVIAPVFLVLPPIRTWQWRRTPEFVLILAASAGTSIYVFYLVDPRDRGVFGWPYLVVLGALWAAMRMGVVVASLVNAIVFLLGLHLTLLGYGSFSGEAMNLTEHLRTAQTLSIVLSATVLVIAVLRDDRLRSLRAAQDSHVFLREVMQAYSDPVFAKAYSSEEPLGRYVLVNEGWSKGTGVPASEAPGRSDRDLLPSDIAEIVWRNDQQVLREDRASVIEERLGPPGEAARIFMSTKFPLHDAAGHPWGVGGVSIDVTDAVRVRELERHNLELMHAVFDLSPTPSLRMMTDATGRARIEAVNAAMSGLVGRPGSALAGVDLDDLFDAEHVADVRETITRALETGSTVQGDHEVPMRSESGREVWVRMSIAPIAGRGADGRAEVVVQFEDVTRRRLAEQALAEQALLDALTGLPNRRALHDRIEQALARLRRHPGTVSVMFCDLDRFKVINDTLGHAAGDQMLVEVAERLRSAVRPEDTVARQGGDEFVVLSEGPRDASDAVLVALRLQESLARPWVYQGQTYSLSMSIGVASTTDPGQSFEELLRQADVAMYRAKEGGRNRTEFYDRSDDELIQETVAIQRDLESAIGTDRLVLHYQPLVDLRTGEVTGAEALVRLRRSDGSTLSPGEFIPHAEASGLVVPMGEQVLKRVTTDVLEWRGRGQARQVALNVSPTQLRQPGFADSLLHRAEDIGIAPTLLAVEVTEHALIRDPMGSARELQALHDAGVTIALDDFGTGYSSLAWLTDYPVDLLKIDRSFTDEMTHNARKAAVVRAVIDVAHDIGIRVVAEGIETDAQRRMLVELDCDLGQGYLFSRPLPADDPYWAAPPSSSSTTATGHR